MKSFARPVPPFPFSFLTLAVLGAAPALAGELSLQGYSGLLNVPGATTLAPGQGSVQYSDQMFERGRYRHNNNVSGTFGLFPYVELGGRLSWDTTHKNLYVENGGVRDLSANVKLSIPFIPEDWFQAAVGIQDIGGEANFFDAKYVVLGRQLGLLHLNVGYGRTDIESRYLDGVFGGVEYRPVQWGALIAEYDAQDVNAGFSLSTLPEWTSLGITANLKVLAFSNNEQADDKRFFALGISFPFGNPKSSTLGLTRSKQESSLLTSAGQSGEPSQYTSGKAISDEVNQVSDAAQTQSSARDVDQIQSNRPHGKTQNYQDQAQTKVHAPLDIEAQLRRLGQDLVDAGYENVQVGMKEDGAVIAFENNIYNRNEWMAIQEVDQMVRLRLVDLTGQAHLVLKNQNLPVLHQPIALKGNVQSGRPGFVDNDLIRDTNWAFEGSNGPHWKPRLMIFPRIASGIATEYGVFDYSLALEYNLTSSLWKGALVSASYTHLVHSSEDFEEGGVFYDSRPRQGVNEFELMQTFKLGASLYTAFHAGRYADDYNGVYNQTLYYTPGGMHGLGFRAGTYEHKDFDESHDQYLAFYRLHLPNYDTSLTLHAGQFWDGDRGFRIDGRFWFGDYALNLIYKNTDAEFVGFGWTIPLTPMRDFNHRYFQVKGRTDWSYNIQTRINADKNEVSFGSATIQRSLNTLEKLYLNNERLFPVY